VKKIKGIMRATTLRRPVQLVSIAVIVFLLKSGHITIAMILIGGSALGILFGKVFCRWMCPMGFIMELMTGAVGDQKAKALYQYHKFGCPIAWISGFLNRISLLTVKHRIVKDCKECGICDKSCYITTLNNTYSLYKPTLKNPADSYACSRCLECVDSCPTGRLAFNIRTPFKQVSSK
jgi:polyferredoxin